MSRLRFSMRPFLVSVILFLAFTPGGCQNKCQHPEIGFRRDNNRHGIIFDTSSEADLRLMESMRNMKDGILRIELSGNADYDLMRLLRIYYDGINVMVRMALLSLKDEQLRQVASRILSTQTLASGVIDSIYLERNSPNFDPSNTNQGLGKEIWRV